MSNGTKLEEACNNDIGFCESGQALCAHWMASIKANARKVVCIGRNYADHVKELENVRPRKPFFFLKPPSSILPPGQGPILKPRGVELHYEVELAVVIGKKVQDLDADDEATAMNAIDGYCLAIDMTARNVQDEAKKKGLPWSIAKGFDTFLPISDFIPKALIPDPHRLELYLSVNGQVKQSDSTALMLFRVPRQMGDISQVMTLEKGDLVLTGTPKGVGPVSVGDLLKAGISNGEQELAMIEVDVKEKGGMYVYAET